MSKKNSQISPTEQSKKINVTRDMVLQADDIRRIEVDVSEWFENGVMTVSTWSSDIRDKFDQYAMETVKKGEGNKGSRSLVVALSVVDPETGELIFSTDDIDQLSRKSWLPMQRLFAAASKLNPLNGAVEAAAKN